MGKYEGEKVLQDPSLVHKSRRHGRFSPEQRHRGPFTKGRERERENNKRTGEKEKHEQEKDLTGKETAQSAALTRAGTHLWLAQAPAGNSPRGPGLRAPEMCRDLREKTKYTPAFGSGERRGLERTSVMGKGMPAPWGELRRHCVPSPALARPGPARCVPGFALPGLGACPVPVPQTLALPPPPGPVWPAAAALGRGPARRGGAAVRAGM